MDSRLKEMTAVLKKYKLTHGLTPEKFRLILQELGPTYIKLGQIMSLHSDILPKEYCEELMKLCSDVEPMPFEQVEAVIDASFGYSWKDVFASIDKKPLGAASIAQVHRATLKTGEQVVVKVQRKGIHEVMSKDMALDEMWAVAQEEMNFLLEASNIEEFAGNNRDVAFVATPKLYRKYTTSHVLVMEYIKGFNIDDKEGLLKDGYDLEEIGSKLIDDYIRQVIEDGFFHADPHPGNVKIRDGKIVWIDMGMMGRLSEHDKKELSNAVYGIAMNDIGMIEDAVLAIGDFRGEPDRAKLYKDIKIIMNKYGSLDMGQVDVAEFIQELLEVMKNNRIVMPHGFTMLARGITQIEGVLADIAPDINMVGIASARIKQEMFKNFDLKGELKKAGKTAYKSAHRMAELPDRLAQILEEYQRGQTSINFDMHASDELARLLHRLVRNIVMGLWVMALLISSSIVCTTDMTPKILGIPALGVMGYVFACIIVLYTIVKHFISRR